MRLPDLKTIDAEIQRRVSQTPAERAERRLEDFRRWLDRVHPGWPSDVDLRAGDA